MNAPTNPDTLFRAQHVGASEVAALFGESPWLTEFELYHRKAGTIDTPDLAENERVYWGLMLEPVIIQSACDRFNYTLAEPTERVSNGRGLGGHPDCVVTCPKRGKGILEVKTVDWLVAKQWGDEPPLHYLMQIQTYMGLLGCTWGDFIVLVGGNELRRFQYEFRPKLFAEIERRVEAFWRAVGERKAPKPDYSRDGKTISALYSEASDDVADLKANNRAAILAAEYLEASETSREAAKRADAAKAELLDLMKDASVALIEGFTVKAGQVAAVADKEITADMVGEVIKGRKSYRRFSIKEHS